jgi:hypothetical protein
MKVVVVQGIGGRNLFEDGRNLSSTHSCGGSFRMDGGL